MMPDAPPIADGHTQAELRRASLRARRYLTTDERNQRSRKITRRIVRLPEFVAARTVGCFISMHDEVDTSALIAHCWRVNKCVFVPVIDRKGAMAFAELLPETVLSRNRFGIWEPRDAVTIRGRKLDVVVTPVVAFDDEGNRIGMGGGYYDRCFDFLGHRRIWRSPKLVGIAFECQRVEKIVPNPWDIRLHRVCTERS